MNQPKIKTETAGQSPKIVAMPARNINQDTIDLLELFYALKAKWMILLAATIIGAVASVFVTVFMITPMYRSEARIYVLTKETTLTSLADLQIGSQLTQDYKELVNSRPVLEAVIDKCNLDMSYKTLLKKVTVSNPANTRILNLTVTDPDPKMAKLIVDEIANTSSEYIGEIMEMIPPKIIEYGVVESKPFSPSKSKNVLKGAMLFFMAAAGLICAGVILDDSIHGEDDVQKYLDLPVLAVIPKVNEAAAAKERDRELARMKKH